MGITVESFPVIVAGSTLNLLPANDAINVTYKREDYVITSIADNAGTISVVLTGISTGSFDIGGKIYVYSEGASYTYDTVGVITAKLPLPLVGDTTLQIDIPFIQVTSSGYVNYKNDWYLEIELRDPVLSFNVLGYTLKDVGDRSGNITVDTSSVVNLISQILDMSSLEQESGRLDYLVYYRESWLDNRSETYVLTDASKIIALDAVEGVTAQTIANSFTTPKAWKTYPILSCLFNSDTNEAGSIVVEFDELDINKSTLTTANALTSLSGKGILQALFDNTFVYDADTKYLRFNWGAITNQVVEVLEPVSLNDYNLEQYEYFLLWFGIDGSPHWYMFTDFESTQEITAKNYNTNTDSPFRLFSSSENTSLVVAENLNDNEFNTIKEITRAKKLYRLLKDETFTELLIVSSTYEKIESNGRFNYSIRVQEKDKVLYK